MKNILRKRLVLISLIGCIFVLFLSLDSRVSEDLYPTESLVNGTSTLPVRLKIESIHVDAIVEYKGLTPEGAVDVPKGPDDVVWFDQGPRPGEIGSAVIVGHRGWKNGRAAVFDNLHTLRKGDTFTVENASGKSLTFVVREIRTYTPNAIVPEVFTSPSGIHLNLITCSGSWEESKKSSTERLVVFTDMVK